MDEKRGKISACLVVHNEESVIERCLKSIDGIVDEIILIHDGDCSDSTLEIAQKYTDKIFVRNFIGEAEPHRAFSFEQANYDWILQIDADEFLSDEAREIMSSLVCNENINAYRFFWPYWDGKKYFTKHYPYKLCLFKKSKASYLAIPHSTVEVAGEVKNIFVHLEHRPLYNNWKLSRFHPKQTNWAKLHAKYLISDFTRLPKFNYSSSVVSWPSTHNRLVRFSPIIFPFIGIYYFLGSLRSGLWKEGVGGWKVALVTGMYFFMVYYYVSIFKKNR